MEIRHFFTRVNPPAATPVFHNAPPGDNGGVASFQCHCGDSSQKSLERQLQNSTIFGFPIKGCGRTFDLNGIADGHSNNLPRSSIESTFGAAGGASLAQLVEQRFRKAWVAGSNPATGSNLRSLDASYGWQAILRVEKA